MLDGEDLYPHFLQESDARASDLKKAGCTVFTHDFRSTASLRHRSFASMQYRARSAVRALLESDGARLFVLCASPAVNGMDLAFDLVKETGGVEPVMAYAPTRFELFGSDSESGIVTEEREGSLNVVVMPCVYLIDHPKRLGMLDACLAQNGSLRLVLTGDVSEVEQLSLLWSSMEHALRSEVVLEFPADDAMERIGSLVAHYASTQSGALHFDDGAVALLAAYCCRVSGDRRYVGICERKFRLLVQEASLRASSAGLAEVSRAQMLYALCADDFRNNFPASSVLRDHRDRQLLISTKGAVTGQINGLSVVETMGTAYEYGEPVRITATARAGGDGDVIDIERKAELAGQIHAKAMMIINGFLTREFGSDQPLPVSASLVFEQSYSEIDGDSASLTGLCAVISALSGVPVRQELAVTGAVDQFGDVQAVGGVNEKIEGFFRVCCLHGLTGGQGVIIPASCVNQLVLRPAVVNAVRAGRFHVFTVTHVTQAVKLLTGIDWGDHETEGTVCCRIAERLCAVSEGVQAPTLRESIVTFFKERLGFGAGDGDERRESEAAEPILKR